MLKLRNAKMCRRCIANENAHNQTEYFDESIHYKRVLRYFTIRIHLMCALFLLSWFFFLSYSLFLRMLNQQKFILFHTRNCVGFMQKTKTTTTYVCEEKKNQRITISAMKNQMTKWIKMNEIEELNVIQSFSISRYHQIYERKTQEREEVGTE